MARRRTIAMRASADDSLIKPILQSRVNTNKSIMPQTRFICSCCGAEFHIQQENFYLNENSPLYAATNQFLPMCKQCVDALFNEYIRILGDRIKAIHRICVHFDYYYSNELAKKIILQSKMTDSVLQSYIDECNLIANKDKTYDTYLSELTDENIKLPSMSEQEEMTLTERWGSGIYNKKEIQLLEEHYQMLKKNNPNIDGNQEVFIKDLCLLNLQKLKSTKQGDTKGILDFTKAYRETFKQSQLQLTTETGTEEDTLGVTLETISRYTPEEYYKNKSLYKDFDNIGDYWKRFVFRPLKNLFLGTNDRDPEYQVKIAEGNTDGTV